MEESWVYSHGLGPEGDKGTIEDWKTTHTLAQLKQNAIDNGWKTLTIKDGHAKYFSDAKDPAAWNTHSDDAWFRGGWIYTPPEDPPKTLNGFDLTNLEA